MKYLISIDGYLSSLISNDDGKYYYVTNKNECRAVIDEYCRSFDIKYKDVSIDFNEKTIDFLVNWFNSDEEEDWSQQQFKLIEIEKA